MRKLVSACDGHFTHSLRSSLVFSSGHSGALRRVRIGIEQLRLQVGPLGSGRCRSGSVHICSVFRSIRLGSVRPGRVRPTM